MGLFTPCAQKSIRRCLVHSHLTRNAGKAVTMSGGLDVLQMKEEDVLKFLAASTHLGGTNMDFQMEQYVYKRKTDGVYIINLRKTWEKLLLAARAIVAIENPADVCVISSKHWTESSPEVCLCYRFQHLPRSFHPWNLHQSDPGCLQGAPTSDRDGSSC